MYVSMEVWLAFTFAVAVLAIIPGPTVLLIMSYALADGRRSAWSMIAGITLANIVALVITLAGLGALLSASAFAYTLLKWLGAGYLIYLGIRMWCAPGELPESRQSGRLQSEQRRIPAGGRMKHAFFVTVLNPKGITFLIAFMPQFLNPEFPLLPQNLLLGVTYVCLCTINAAAYAFLVGGFRDRLLRRGVLRTANRIGGTLLIGAGGLTAALQRT